MEFHQLRYFEAAARLGSMAAAAAACHVSQPALSVQIRKLEEEAGARLLVREARGVRPTAAGERTLAIAREILRGAEEWRSGMRSGAFPPVRRTRLAVQPFVSVGLVASVLAPMLRAGEGNWLRLLERVSSSIPAMLRTGEADAALLDLSAAPLRGFRSATYLEFPYALFAHESSPLLRRRGAVSLEEAVSRDFLLAALAPGLPAAIQRLGCDPVFSGDHAGALLELVAAKAGVAILPSILSAQAARAGVRTRPLRDYDATVAIGLLWPSGAEAPTVALRLASRLRAAYPQWATRRGA